MMLANEDELAIHTVAAAAYRILRDMLGKRGRHDFEDLMRAGLYEFAKAFAHGGISKKELDELQLYDLVSAIAEDMKVRGDNVTVDGIPILLDASSKKAHWQAMSGVSGFLKHADRLPEAMISLQEVNNESLLMHACAAYAMVRHTSTPEMVVFYFFWSAAPGRRAGLDASG